MTTVGKLAGGGGGRGGDGRGPLGRWDVGACVRVTYMEWGLLVSSGGRVGEGWGLSRHSVHEPPLFQLCHPPSSNV